jgi:hypothetical protein
LGYASSRPQRRQGDLAATIEAADELSVAHCAGIGAEDQDFADDPAEQGADSKAGRQVGPWLAASTTRHRNRRDVRGTSQSHTDRRSNPRERQYELLAREIIEDE